MVSIAATFLSGEVIFIVSTLVTIGIPTYNRAHVIDRALASARKQTWSQLEILVSDNASTDNTADYVRQVAAADDRIRYHRMDANAGPSPNFRWLRDNARGDYFMWLADDDWLDEAYVERCARVLAKNSDVLLSSGRVTYCLGDRAVHDGRALRVMQDDAASRILAYYRSVGDNGSFYGLFRRAAMPELPRRQLMGYDWMYVARGLARGKLEHTPEARLYRNYVPVEDYHIRYARAVRLSVLHELAPGLALALSAASDVVLAPDQYPRISGLQRGLLAANILRTIAGRLDLSLANVRTKLKHLAEVLRGKANIRGR